MKVDRVDRLLLGSVAGDRQRQKHYNTKGLQLRPSAGEPNCKRVKSRIFCGRYSAWALEAQLQASLSVTLSFSRL
jgi:hypothetical protein